MSFAENITRNLPEVKAPDAKKVDFSTKFKWTLTILLAYFLLGLVPLNGLADNALEQFTFLSVILGAEFGSLITLGIGPIVTASIILQLLNGSGIISFNLQTSEGKKQFQSWQRVLAIVFIFFESIIFVVSGGLTPEVGVSPMWLIFQLIIGGFLIVYMDEVVAKWGFGSGLSLFIAAGVSKSLMLQLLSPLTQAGTLAWPFVGQEPPAGALFALLHALAVEASTREFMIQVLAILATAIVFAMAVLAISMKVEIPLSFGRARGFGIRWPLNFVYTSNIPVILIAALIANFQLLARLVHSSVGDSWFAQFVEDSPQPTGGFVTWLFPDSIIRHVLDGTLTPLIVTQSLFYLVIMMLGAMMFSIFWMQSAGMDAKSLAKQIQSSGLQVPGFRRDPRVLEKLLERYVLPLSILGGLTIGFLAAIADLSGALTSGAGLLLATMIIYQLYQEIAKQHQMDMHPLMKKFVEAT